MTRDPAPERAAAGIGVATPAGPAWAPLGVVGLGLIGCSIGLRASSLGARVVGLDREPAHVATALARGAIAAGAPDLAALCADVRALVLATPLDVACAQLAELAALARAGAPMPALVLDAASAKGAVARAGAALATFVPSHPMAGTERSGPEAGRADLFVGRVWTYDPARDPAAIGRARAFVEAMGAVPFAVASDAHDRDVAVTSHAPQLVSVAMASLAAARLAEPGVAALVGGGLRSMLRLGSSPWTMWRPVYAANGPAVAAEARRLAAELERLAAALDAGDEAALAAAFAAAAEATARANANEGDAARVASATHLPG